MCMQIVIFFHLFARTIQNDQLKQHIKEIENFQADTFFHMLKSKPKGAQSQWRVFLYPVSSMFAALIEHDLNQHIQASRIVLPWSYVIISPAGGRFLNTDWSGKATTIHTHIEKTSSPAVLSVQPTASLQLSKIWTFQKFVPKNLFQALLLVFGLCFGNMQWIQLNLANSLSHTYVLSAHGDLLKKWADTLANQNKNRMILDA